jgi:hypothetical protein
MLKFTLSPIVFFAVYFMYFKYEIHFKIEKKNILLMVYLLFSFIITMAIEKYLLFNYKINFIIAIGLTGISFLMLEQSEKIYILKRIKIRK